MDDRRVYKGDDEFKARARARQFVFCEEESLELNEGKAPQVLLSPRESCRGMIFCDVYRDLIREKTGTFGTRPLFANMLRSEHIPFNIFTPMEEDLDGAVQLFNEIIGGGIREIKHILIEFAGHSDKSAYLNDGTSFDAYIEYTGTDDEPGGIGIEVKYTENGYLVGERERNEMLRTDGPYRMKTKKSGYFVESLDIDMLVHANHLRQIWRNHLLGFAMIDNGDIRHFHHIHLYPQGNRHFHEYALPEYKKLLTSEGKRTFMDITYESLFGMMRRYFTSVKQTEWIAYLYRRYLF